MDCNKFIKLLAWTAIVSLVSFCKLPEPKLTISNCTIKLGKHLNKDFTIGSYSYSDLCNITKAEGENGKYKIFISLNPATVKTKSQENLMQYGKKEVEKPVPSATKYVTLKGLVPDKIYLEFIDNNGKVMMSLPPFVSTNLSGNSESLPISFIADIEDEKVINDLIINKAVGGYKISVDDSEYEAFLKQRKNMIAKYSDIVRRHEYFVDKFIDHYKKHGTLSAEWSDKMGNVNLEMDYSYQQSRMLKEHYVRWQRNSQRYIDCIQKYRSI